jgi:2-dehydro-3-deoxyphosphogluconate aldolase/(4S)-4-hydroxy-2-oxoglutarate aldolase
MTLHRAGVVPVVELGRVEDATPMLNALVAGGLPVAEVTLRTAAGLEAIRILRASSPGALIGAGTVLSVEAAHAAIEAGAQFVASPSVDREVIAVCRAARVPVAAGACTPTEVDSAVRAGADVVKFFPAEPMGGTTFLRALAGPFAGVRFMPTGGINAANLAAYLQIPQVLACGGSWMVAPALLAEGRFDEVETLAREAVAIAAEGRVDG